MERKQGFFAALKDELVRGLSPARSRGKTPAKTRSPATAPPPFPRNRRPKSSPEQPPPVIYGRSGSFRPVGEVLEPLVEGPEGRDAEDAAGAARRERWGNWLSRVPSSLSSGRGASGGVGSSSSSSSFRRSDLRLLIGVMGAPLAPVHVSTADPLPLLSIKGMPIETSSAQYILQQYIASSGGLKLLKSIRNAYTMGKVRMIASEFETATKVVKNCGGALRAAENGSFVLWQMSPDMWYVELAVGGSKVHAGCNGEVVWRHTPWLGAHAAKGPIRPLRRALQGIDPLTTASLFADARCIGEKKVDGEECFILKLSADPETLRARSEGPSEIIRHVLFGYFSQRTGLLVHIEDSHLTRIQSNLGGEAIYWETTINSFIDDYLPVEGMMIAHSGRSIVTLFRFGEASMSHTKTRMEETWTIEEVAFNVPGLSMDCFIPPADLRCDSVSETSEFARGERTKTSIGHRSKIAAVDKSLDDDDDDKFEWRVEV